MTVKIGHAHSDEYNKAKGGKAGDQTGNEVVVQEWYLRTKGWTYVFRAKDTRVSEKIATVMEQACSNNNIGYDQSQRTTLYTYAEKYSWDLSKIIEKCECDCSSLVAVCVNAAGIRVSKDMYTGNQKTVLSNTSKFKILSDKKYLITDKHLKRGDILLGPGHTAVVLSAAEAPQLEKAKSFLKTYSGTYRVTADQLNLRYGAGKDRKIITTLSKGTKVKCYGYYTSHFDTDWLYIQTTSNGSDFTGFVSARYLTK